MPWKEVSIMAMRKEFISLAKTRQISIRQMCHRYGISPTTGYKWIRRFDEKGNDGLKDLSRRPFHSPIKTSTELESRVLWVRDMSPAWGARKIKAWLINHGEDGLPSASTIHAILERNGRIDPSKAHKHRAYKRFEKQQPNELWQMDFKARLAMNSGYCYPLTVLDDHSRFALGVEACANQREVTVKDKLTNIFRIYGMPLGLLMDNGSPWGYRLEQPYTTLGVWLMRLGVGIHHGRPYHPQTQGKDERFHRTVDEELLCRRNFRSLEDCQYAFDEWRDIYNLQRPHQALNYATPASRYHMSLRPFPEVLPLLEYDDPRLVRRVDDNGRVSFKGHLFKVGKGFIGMPVALRPTTTDGVWDVVFSSYTIKQVDIRCSHQA